MNAHAIIVIILLGLILLLGACVLFYFFYERDHFLLVARTPQLATLSAATSLVIIFTIFLQDFLTAINVDFPCVADLVLSYVYPPLYAFPYLLRGWRLMVIYVPVLRKRYTNTTRQATLYRIVFFFLTVHVIVLVLLATLLPQYRLLKSGCHYYDEWYVGFTLWAFYIGLLIYIVRFLSTRGILTVYNITAELKAVCITWGASFGIYFALRIAAYHSHTFNRELDNFEDKYFHTHYIILVNNLISFYVSIFTPIYGLYRGDAKKYEEQLKTVSKSRTQSFMEEDRAAHHLIQDILHHEESCKLFKKHAEKFLCVENVMFWQEVDSYMMNFTTVQSGLGETRASNPSCSQALRIYTRFIRPNCIFQVNIPGGHQKELMDLFEPKEPLVSSSSTSSTTRGLQDGDDGGQIVEQQVILRQGVLRKLGGFRQNWKERYFVLTDDDTLSYYKSQYAFQMGEDALGTIYLLGAAIRVFSDVTYKKGNTFGVHPANEERTYVCSASTPEDRQEWLIALRKENIDKSPMSDMKTSSIVQSPSDLSSVPSPPSSPQSLSLSQPLPVQDSDFKSEKRDSAEDGKQIRTITPLVLSDPPLDPQSPSPLIVLPSEIEDNNTIPPPPTRDRLSTVCPPPPADIPPPPSHPHKPTNSLHNWDNNNNNRTTHSDSINLPITFSNLPTSQSAINKITYDMEMVINPVHLGKAQRENRSETYCERYPFAKKLSKDTFNDSQNDIEKLLMFNVMKSFKTSPEFLKLKETVKENSQVLDALQLMGSRRSSSKIRKK